MIRVVMINDCAFVGENLSKYFCGTNIMRSRNIFNKTLGLSWRILRSHGDLYHVNYLLQDCYIASKLGKKPLIGHAHGSDLRVGLKHFLLRRIVKNNLSSCSKVIVSTPDLLGIARSFRSDAVYLPNLVDETFFYVEPKKFEKKVKVLIASEQNWDVKGSNIALFALSLIKDKIDVSIIAHGKDLFKSMIYANSLKLNLNLLPTVSHSEMNQYYWSHDVVIDRFALGSLGIVSLEAVNCGRPVLCFVCSAFPEHKDFPLLDLLNPIKIAELVLDPGDLWEKEWAFVNKYHHPNFVIPLLCEIYGECFE